MSYRIRYLKPLHIGPRPVLGNHSAEANNSQATVLRTVAASSQFHESQVTISSDRLDKNVEPRPPSIYGAALLAEHSKSTSSLNNVPDIGKGSPSHRVGIGSRAHRDRPRPSIPAAKWSTDGDLVSPGYGDDASLIKAATSHSERRKVVSQSQIARQIFRANHKFKISFWELWRVIVWEVLVPISEDRNAFAERLFANQRRQLQQNKAPSSQFPHDTEPTTDLALLAAALTISAPLALQHIRTARIPFRRRLVLADCLFYVKKRYGKELAASADLRAEFETILTSIVDAWVVPIPLMSEIHLRLFLDHLDLERGLQFVDKFLIIKPELHNPSSIEGVPPNDNATIFLVDFFLRHQQPEQALRMLGMLSEDSRNSPSSTILQRCTKLLKMDVIEPSGDSENFKILPRILEMGISLDVPLYTLAMQNAFAASKSSVGSDLFRYMQSQGLVPAPQTYLALLHDSYRRRHEQDLNEILTAIHDREDLSCNQHLACSTMNIVRMICRFEKRLPWRDSQAQMMSVYDRAFDRSILAKLQIDIPPLPPPPETPTTTAAHSSFPPPTPQTLGHLIWLQAVNSSSKLFVDALWTRLTHLIAAHDPDLTPASAHPVLYDGFLLFYARHPAWLPDCLRVFAYMLAAGGAEGAPPPPGERTWRTLGAALVRHDQLALARRVHGAMVDRGLRPEGEMWDRIRDWGIGEAERGLAERWLEGRERSVDDFV